MEDLLKSATLIRRAYWLIQLQWAAIGALVASTFMGVSLPASTLYIISALLLIYNLILRDLLRY